MREIKTRALLFSNSYSSGLGFLEHGLKAIESFLADCHGRIILFAPFAKNESKWDGYAETARILFNRLGFEVLSFHEPSGSDYIYQNLESIAAVFCPGGNTFRLSRGMSSLDIEDELVSQIKFKANIKYIGSSAGSVYACPTIKTTNDMPIVKPYDLGALNLIPWQINAHFVSGKLLPDHMGESREERIKEYHEENDLPVIALPEGSYLIINGVKATLMGGYQATIFRKDSREIWNPGLTISMS